MCSTALKKGQTKLARFLCTNAPQCLPHLQRLPGRNHRRCPATCSRSINAQLRGSTYNSSSIPSSAAPTRHQLAANNIENTGRSSGTTRECPADNRTVALAAGKLETTPRRGRGVRRAAPEVPGSAGDQATLRCAGGGDLEVAGSGDDSSRSGGGRGGRACRSRRGGGLRRCGGRGASDRGTGDLGTVVDVSAAVRGGACG